MMRRKSLPIVAVSPFPVKSLRNNAPRELLYIRKIPPVVKEIF
jgi:hypothetical protein